MRKTRASLWALGLTAVTAAVLFVLPITPKVAVESAPIARGSLRRFLSADAVVTRRQETPALTPVAGWVAEVCVRQGQQVEQGQLLLRLDTSLEEETLRQLTQLRLEAEASLAALPAGQDALLAWAGASRLELLTQAEECRLAIEAKQVRAGQNGVVGQVYLQPGAYAASGSVATTVYQSGLQVAVTQRAQDCAGLAPGARALVTQNGTCALAELCAFGEPVWQETGYWQTLTFDVEAGAALQAGSPAELDILRDTVDGVPVAPLRALTRDGALWVVRDGKAYKEPVDVTQRDAEQVRVPERLLGLSVILEPNEDKLYPGAAVKERRR